MATWDRERLFRLIPEAREFDWVADLCPLGWMAHAGTAGQAIAYSDLFWPAFVEHDECVLLAERLDPANFLAWMDATGGNRRAVEAVLNHLHVADLFGAEGPGLAARPELTAGQAVHLGRLLQEMWAAKLARDFPGRRFTVTFPDDERADLTEYEVTFFQEHEQTTGT